MPGPSKVLLIEDEPSISGFIKGGLEDIGCEVMQAFDGELGLKLAKKNRHDIIILDVVLPGLNGLRVCEVIRKELEIKTPILMLTALDDTDDIVTGLDAGADDYLSKPFQFKELLARMRALLRRPGIDVVTKRVIEVEDLVIDLDKTSVHRKGVEIKLTPKEFFLLKYMVLNKNKVLSRAQILEKVWEIQFDLGTNVVDVYMNYLRKKIDKPFKKPLVQTIVGMGYMLKVEE
jgi:DNA-binding response OmpR family regulator